MVASVTPSPPNPLSRKRERGLCVVRRHQPRSRRGWRGNFRDFNAAVTRMATLSTGGRITNEAVDEELAAAT